MSALSSWTRKIEESDLPILQYTAVSIMQKVDKDDTSASHLAKIILRDSSLTARLLRVANSAMVNPGKIPVNTIQRAVLFLGFDMIRSLCLSLSLIDTLLKSSAQAQVKALMAKSFQCAVMARELAVSRGDKAPEEVFVAALLSSIGEMAFWCVDTDKGEEVNLRAALTGCSLPQAQRDVLGFTYDELTLALTSDLTLGKTLEASFSGAAGDKPRIRELQIARSFAESASGNLDDGNTRKIIGDIAAHLKMDTAKARDLLIRQSDTARDVVGEYGAGDLAGFLPNFNDGEDGAGEQATAAGMAGNLPVFTETDPALQMAILKDLGNTLDSNPSPDMVLQIVLEGINRGVGMDRCLLALLSPDRAWLSGKFTLGCKTDTLAGGFRFAMNGASLFNHIIEAGQAVWLQEGKQDPLSAFLNVGLLSVLETRSFMVYPLIVKKKAIGLIYADRKPSRRQLTEEHFNNFRHFGQQACMAIDYIAST